ncbi:MAG: DUF2752 domain-containing protein [Thermoguttaceae bacterium]|jgi:hypothetical protein|nr:DUF2752 domain-containing protein [Thermoguttaceae bacterium]
MTNSNPEVDAVPLIPVDQAARSSQAIWYFRANLAALTLVLLAFGFAKTPVVADGHLLVFGFRLPETCASKLLLGRPCIGCGLTKSLVLAVAGQWTESRAFHPAGIWVAGWLASQAVARAALLLIRPGRSIFWQADAAASFISLLAVLYVPPIVA